MSKSKLTKRKLINCIAVDQGISEVKAKEIVDKIFELFIESVARKEPVLITGLGCLQVVRGNSRMVGFGEKYKSKAINRVKFISSKELYKRLNKIEEDKMEAALKAFKRSQLEDTAD